ncbi:MAG: adenylate kinase [Sphaerochaetaceae bacterium]|jgi:adenylate kinase
MKLVFLGPPGAGKGTIATLAKERLDLLHISTGDLFRAARSSDTPLGRQVAGILDRGELVPDEITIEVVRQQLASLQRGFILDGFPRTIGQADALGTMVEIDHVVNFVLDREEIIKRLSGRRMCKSTGKIYHIIYNPPKVDGIDDQTGEALIQREDDKEEAILNRLTVYARQTEPLISYYKERGLLRDVEAYQAPEEVYKLMLKAIGL